MAKWLEKAIFYEIYPQSFYDSNGDGIGDINGISQKLDYVKQLGCNAIWINPCFDSPFMDGGYDVRDYKKVAKRYGTNDDLKKLFEKAHSMDMHIILDLVPGHTSETHPWFLESKKPTKNEYSSRYIWTDSVWNYPPEYRLISGVNDRNGNYLVNFFSSQPALNYGFNEITHPEWQLPYDHPECQKTIEAMKDVMRFWLDMGCDGFRVDMADSLVKNDDEKTATALVWKNVRKMLDEEYPEAVLVSEWCCPKRSLKCGFDADFYLDHMYSGYKTAFRNIDDNGNDNSFFSKNGQGDITVLTEQLCSDLEETKGHGHVSFITCNHDTPRLSKYMDETELKIALCAIFTLPGVPFLYYGDEIGMRYMEDLISKEGGFQRTGSRTPMQWDSSKNLGFSTADEDSIYLPVDKSEDAPTVEKMQNDKTSLYNTVKAILALRNEYDDLSASGSFEVLFAKKNKYPFIFKRGNLIIVTNPSLKTQTAEISLSVTKELFKIGDTHIDDSGITIEPQSFIIYSE